MIEHRKVTIAMLEEAQALGMCIKEAAEHFGFHRVTVSRVAKKAGIVLITEKQKIKATNAKSRGTKGSIKAWSAKPSAIAKALDAAQARRAAMIGAKP
jgi:transposase